MSQIDLFGLPLTASTLDEAVKTITESIRLKDPAYYCFASAHSMVEGVFNKAHRAALKTAKAVYADGVPVAKAIQWIKSQPADRISGLDILEKILAECEETQARVFIYGASDSLLDTFETECRKQFPTINLVGHYSPPQTKNPQDFLKPKHLESLNAAQADVVIVALGCPKQEIWMAEVSKEIPAVYLGIGYAISVASGVKTRAPLWMQKHALEWFHRCLQDPFRLTWRYASSNTLFLLFCALESISKNWTKRLV